MSGILKKIEDIVKPVGLANEKLREAKSFFEDTEDTSKAKLKDLIEMGGLDGSTWRASYGGNTLKRTSIIYLHSDYRSQAFLKNFPRTHLGIVDIYSNWEGELIIRGSVENIIKFTKNHGMCIINLRVAKTGLFFDVERPIHCPKFFEGDWC